jgi:hypothetical protein
VTVLDRLWGTNLSINTIFGSLATITAAAVIVWLVRRRRSGIGFKTLDEVAVVQELMAWVVKNEPTRRNQLLFANPLMFRGIVALQSISREDLSVLAPYIDEWIEGRLPPQHLPAEYEDYRPRVLLGFKQRLQSEGRWPLAISRRKFADREKRA